MPKIKRNCFGWFPPKQKKAQYSPEKETEREREGEEGERETDRTIQHSLKSCQNLILLKTNLSLILLRNFFMRDILWRWRSRQLDEKRKINLRVQKYQLWEFVKTEGTGKKWKMELKFLALQNGVVETFGSMMLQIFLDKIREALWNKSTFQPNFFYSVNVLSLAVFKPVTGRSFRLKPRGPPLSQLNRC